MVSKPSRIVFGLHAIRHILKSAPADILELWVGGRRSAKAVRELAGMAENNGIPVQVVPDKTLTRIARSAHHQGIIARCRLPVAGNTLSLRSVLGGDGLSRSLFLVLDGIQDPHNLGACLRVADAAGVQAVILPKDRAAGLSGSVYKVASGAVEYVPVIRVTNLARALREMRKAGVWIVGADPGAGATVYAEELALPMALVVGSEDKGLRRNTLSLCDKLVSVPMSGLVESLNVAVAAGICLFEIGRRHRLFS